MESPLRDTDVRIGAIKRSREAGKLDRGKDKCHLSFAVYDPCFSLNHD